MADVTITEEYLKALLECERRLRMAVNTLRCCGYSPREEESALAKLDEIRKGQA